MNFRLQQFLSAENITQAQFADMIGVARASVSHILAGRNKPGFDFIQSMSRAFPDLNLEWLINGKGRMYKDDRKEPVQNAQPTEGQLFGAPQDAALTPPVPQPESPSDTLVPATETTMKIESQVSGYKVVKPSEPKVMVQDVGRKIKRIVVFYDDNSYQELREV